MSNTAEGTYTVPIIFSSLSLCVKLSCDCHVNIDDNTKPKTVWKTIICLDIPWLALKVWPVLVQGGEIKTHTSLTSPPPCFPGNFMETLKKFHQSFRTSKNAFWTPKNWFSAPTFHQKIEIWHQKRCFPTPASRCTKNGQTPGLHQSCTTPPPPEHQNWPNVLSQSGVWQYIL